MRAPTPSFPDNGRGRGVARIRAGVVLFAGEETKMRLNATPAPTKSPTMERMTNRVVIAIFIFLVLLTIVFSSLAVVGACIPHPTQPPDPRSLMTRRHAGHP